MSVWAAGDAYEPYVGRWSRLVAQEFVRWLDRPSDLDWLDVGSGTGALSRVILEHASPRSVTGVEPSPAFIEYASGKVTSPVVTFRAGDAQDIPLADGSVDTVVSGLVLNFVPEPARALDEMTRVTRPDGVVAAYVWDYSGEMQLMRCFWDAAVTLDPAAAPLAEGARFPMCSPEPLTELFGNAGLQGVEARAIDVPTRFRDFDDYWTPFLGGTGPAPAYVMSLPDDKRQALSDLLRERLPASDDGSIDLVARAWAVRGTTS